MKSYKFCRECGTIVTKLDVGSKCRCLEKGTIYGIVFSDEMDKKMKKKLDKYGMQFILDNVLKGSKVNIYEKNFVIYVDNPKIVGGGEEIPNSKWITGISPVRH